MLIDEQTGANHPKGQFQYLSYMHNPLIPLLLGIPQILDDLGEKG
jgi:hypothetical protein